MLYELWRHKGGRCDHHGPSGPQVGLTSRSTRGCDRVALNGGSRLQRRDGELWKSYPPDHSRYEDKVEVLGGARWYRDLNPLHTSQQKSVRFSDFDVEERRSHTVVVYGQRQVEGRAELATRRV